MTEHEFRWQKMREQITELEADNQVLVRENADLWCEAVRLGNELGFVRARLAEAERVRDEHLESAKRGWDAAQAHEERGLRWQDKHDEVLHTLDCVRVDLANAEAERDTARRHLARIEKLEEALREARNETTFWIRQKIDAVLAQTEETK